MSTYNPSVGKLLASSASKLFTQDAADVIRQEMLCFGLLVSLFVRPYVRLSQILIIWYPVYYKTQHYQTFSIYVGLLRVDDERFKLRGRRSKFKVTVGQLYRTMHFWGIFSEYVTTDIILVSRRSSVATRSDIWVSFGAGVRRHPHQCLGVGESYS